MNPRTLAFFAAAGVVYAVWLWLSYVIVYQRGREEATAILIAKGAGSLRDKLRAEEGISNDGS